MNKIVDVTRNILFTVVYYTMMFMAGIIMPVLYTHAPYWFIGCSKFLIRAQKLLGRR